ncbi:MAG: hypothetical protein HQK49_09185 [Oligoflexia bacterium]|nr:hypothetical protein [Oligoflexia bacterium]
MRIFLIIFIIFAAAALATTTTATATATATTPKSITVAVDVAVAVGERDHLDDYSGSTFPSYKLNYYNGELEDLDIYYQKKILDNYWPTSLMELRDFFSEELIEGYRCPNTLLNKYYDYIHYLYRLLALSYLYESINDYKSVVEKLRLEKTKVCIVDWPTFVNKCKPKTLEMIKFKKRSAVLFEHLASEDRVTRYFTAKEKELWFKNLKATREDPPPKGITYTRIHDWCYINNISCSEIGPNNLVNVMNDACQNDKEIFLKICSEEDTLYGVSLAPILKDLLSEAHTMPLINIEGKGRGCLDRFVNIFRRKERVPIYLNDLFWEAYHKISLSRSTAEQRYPQGRIFVAGSLKEFDDKGLNLSLFLMPSPSPSPIPVVAVITPKPTPKPIALVVAKDDKQPTIKPIPTPTPIPTVKPTIDLPKLSAFEDACASARAKAQEASITSKENNKQEAIPVNMNKFKKDYSFTPKTLKFLLKAISQYKTQEALTYMKKHDGLGEKRSPLPLVFLKIMIDQRDYHALFNIVRIVGEEFYVINDLEKKKDPILVKFKTDDATAEWQILVSAM